MGLRISTIAHVPYDPTAFESYVPNGSDANLPQVEAPRFSADGRYVVFGAGYSYQFGISGDINGPAKDIYREDLTTGVVEVISTYVSP